MKLKVSALMILMFVFAMLLTAETSNVPKITNEMSLLEISGHRDVQIPVKKLIYY